VHWSFHELLYERFWVWICIPRFQILPHDASSLVLDSCLSRLHYGRRLVRFLRLLCLYQKNSLLFYHGINSPLSNSIFCIVKCLILSVKKKDKNAEANSPHHSSSTVFRFSSSLPLEYGRYRRFGSGNCYVVKILNRLRIFTNLPKPNWICYRCPLTRTISIIVPANAKKMKAHLDLSLETLGFQDHRIAEMSANRLLS